MLLLMGVAWVVFFAEAAGYCATIVVQVSVGDDDLTRPFPCAILLGLPLLHSRLLLPLLVSVALSPPRCALRRPTLFRTLLFCSPFLVIALLLHSRRSFASLPSQRTLHSTHFIALPSQCSLSSRLSHQIFITLSISTWFSSARLSSLFLFCAFFIALIIALVIALFVAVSIHQCLHLARHSAPCAFTSLLRITPLPSDRSHQLAPFTALSSHCSAHSSVSSSSLKLTTSVRSVVASNAEPQPPICRSRKRRAGCSV